MKKEIEVRFERCAVVLATVAACGGSAPQVSHASQVEKGGETSNAAPSDTRPYGYEFAPVAPEVEKAKPAPPASLPVGPGGRLFPEAISGVVRNHFDEIGRCYEAGQRKNAKLAGTITVKSSFGRDGYPSDVADQGSTLPDKEVVDCVVSVFRALRYPTSRGGQVTFVYPIKLGS